MLILVFDRWRVFYKLLLFTSTMQIRGKQAEYYLLSWIPLNGRLFLTSIQTMIWITVLTWITYASEYLYRVMLWLVILSSCSNLTLTRHWKQHPSNNHLVLYNINFGKHEFFCYCKQVILFYNWPIKHYLVAIHLTGLDFLNVIFSDHGGTYECLAAVLIWLVKI